MYFVINLDIRNSRKLIERNVLQEKLTALIHDLNQSEHVVSLFDIVLGDEIQGLIRGNSHLIDFLDLIERFQETNQMAFTIGIGYGELTTRINNIEVEKNDGAAFHLARQAINEGKKKGQPSFMILGQTFNHFQNSYNLYLKLSRQLSNQAMNIKQYLGKGMTQTDIAEKLGTKQSSISRTITRSHLIEIMQLKETCDYLLEKALEA